MELKGQSQTQDKCPEIIDEETEALIDYQDKVQVTSSGKYRCRDCGAIFDTLEEHDKHHRTVHSHVVAYINQGMTM